MRVVVAGLGIQGRKRLQIAGEDAVATVDPVVADADYRRIEEVPLASYDAVLACVPDAAKPTLLTWLLEHGKHVLVEKPLLAPDDGLISRLAELARSRGLACYTAYNHRFEPHLAALKGILQEGRLGRLYMARMFYGNGTARDVRNSPWRDQGAGVLPDLGSHLLDLALYLFAARDHRWQVWVADRFENNSFDHVVVGGTGEPRIELEMTLLSWRNHFVCDVYGELGSAHVASLCKWGPTTLTVRTRKLPSGRPDEETVELVQADPTWAAEYAHFKTLVGTGGDNLDDGLWLNRTLGELARQAAGAER